MLHPSSLHAPAPVVSAPAGPDAGNFLLRCIHSACADPALLGFSENLFTGNFVTLSEKLQDQILCGCYLRLRGSTTEQTIGRYILVTIQPPEPLFISQTKCQGLPIGQQGRLVV